MYARKHYRTGFFGWSIIALFGSVLVVAALPRLAAEYNRLGATPIVKAISENKREVRGDAKEYAINNLNVAVSFTPENRALYNALATMDLFLYEGYKSGAESDRAFKSLKLAQENFQKALRTAPGDANIWYLLAETGVRLQGADARALEALRISYLIGPREGWIAHRRLGLSLRLWPLLPTGTRKMVLREIRMLWISGGYHTVLVRHFLRAGKTGQEAVISEISKLGEKQTSRFRLLVKRLDQRR